MGQADISHGHEIHHAVEGGYESLVRLSEEREKTLDLLVEGVHCAACIQKIESLFKNDNDIKNARLNFSTRKLSLIWSGPDENANVYVEKLKNIGYDAVPFNPSLEQDQALAEERFLLLCLGVSGFAMGNIMLLSVGLWTTDAQTMGIATRDFLHWISALIALPSVIFSGRPFFRSAISALRHGRTNMDVPISIGITLACTLSLIETMRSGEHVFFDSAVMLIFFLLIGRYLDFRARKQARSAATDVLRSLTGFADVLEEGKVCRRPASELKTGMIVRVAMGGKFPADGVVIEGEGQADTALMTGETIPHSISAGSSVYAGTVNLSAPIIMRVSGAGENTILSDVIRLMEKAEQGQARYVRLADRAARLYTPIVHTFAAATFLVWWLGFGLVWQKSLMIAVSVLIITCPCALALAVPVVQVLATGLLMRRGILIKAGDALERLAGVDIVFADKTGTLTTGKPALVSGMDDPLLPVAASLASHSNHPLSRALQAGYSGQLPFVEQVREVPGFGLEGLYQGRRARLGSRVWCGVEGGSGEGFMELWFVLDSDPPIVFCFEDALRPDAASVVALFKRDGLKISLLSGDSMPVVAKIAHEAGIEDFHAAMTPPQKFEMLEKTQAAGHKILMIGDGLNDAPTLAGADVSMAPGTAIELAQNAADIVFMGDRFMPVREVIRTARRSQTLVKQNLALAVLYNVIAVPLAVCGFVTPFIAALAMSGSSLIVIANSFRLKWRA